MLLSVVIPLFNKRESIRSTITSVLNQDYAGFELIIVNDGSTDGSEHIVREFDDKRIRLINIKNSGVSVARNTGIEAAKSEYVCLLDADDYWKSAHLLKIANLIALYPQCALYSSCYYEILEDGTTFIPKNKYSRDYMGMLEDFFQDYSHSRGLINSSSVCLNKFLFQKMGGFPRNIKLGEDIYVWLKMSMLGEVAYSGDPQVVIRRNAENRTSTRVNNDILYHIKYFHEHPDEKNTLSCKRIKSLNIFLKKNIFINALYSLSIKDKGTFDKYLIALKSISLSYYIYLSVLGKILNPKLLRILRKLRNRIQSS
ncbi:glycosyltransferase family 2 protein [Citrobacter sp. ANG330]|uniref:glycosyltransferase family 2 protein n=1 Tax=Citrobacter sp. ANG330 TaxID=3048142 RepID=UPI0039C05F7D|nr:glycosyltransferase family 2 protein [Citrobacter amalonaticus]